jgi:hypothetical protein
MSKKRVFVDGVESISFIEGMVHMELFNFVAGTQKEKDQLPEREETEELIMTPKGFLRAYSAMEKLVKQLADAGVVSRKENQSTDSSKPEAVSPNFSN